MTVTILCLVFAIAIVLCNTSFIIGFYCGYLKREDKPPEIPQFPRVLRMPRKEKEEKLSKEEEKANSFYN